MVFSSMTFLCIFLPVVFILHCLLPGTPAKNAMLTVASLLFYAYGEPVYVLLLFVLTLFDYFCAMVIALYRRRKILLGLCVAGNLAVLIYFKYMGFLLKGLGLFTGFTFSEPAIRMPIGISFFTFQAISYVIDVGRGVTEAEKNYGKVLLYISFFPQLIAGPIVKYHDIADEIDCRSQSVEAVSLGIRRFAAGLSKKVLIANTMGLAADALFGAPQDRIGCLAAWLGAVSYMLQIYFDFSGYSDMAIGMGWMFGFHFRENFEYPYISKSVREFWRRWHISLSGWFREYLYIPLGGSRRGKLRTVLNKMIVFLCTGIWHGASVNFLFWGIYHGFFQMLEEYVPAIREPGGKIKGLFQHIYVLLAVLVGFVFFRADTMRQGFLWVKAMFTGYKWADPAVLSLVLQQLTPIYLLALAAAFAASLPVKQKMKEIAGYERFAFLASIAGFVLCILNLSGGTYNPFIYFRF